MADRVGAGSERCPRMRGDSPRAGALTHAWVARHTDFDHAQIICLACSGSEYEECGFHGVLSCSSADIHVHGGGSNGFDHATS